MTSGQSFDPDGAAREALRVMVTDPDYGPAVLSNPPVLANLLKDLLPDEPRASGLLVAAADAGLPGALLEQAGRHLDAATARNLVAATFAEQTAFTPQACYWAVGELAIALGLDHPGAPRAAPPAARPGTAQPSTGQPGTGQPGTAQPGTPPPDTRPPRLPPEQYAAAQRYAGRQDEERPTEAAPPYPRQAPAPVPDYVAGQPPPAPIASPAPHASGGTARYSFTVIPTLATKYSVRIFAGPGAGAPLATSASRTVYVASVQLLPSRLAACGRPVCRQSVIVRYLVPPPALQTEIAKPLFFYFGLALSATGIPPQPVDLRLGAGNPVISAPTRIAPDEFQVPITLSYTIGNDAYYSSFRTCLQDSESQDGVGLPGRHGCGDPVINYKLARFYLG